MFCQFSSVILPVVSIYAEGTVVVNVVDRAEASLIVEHKEVGVKFEVVQKLNQNITLGVGVAAIIPKLAFMQIIREVDTETAFIVVRMVVELY